MARTEYNPQDVPNNPVVPEMLAQLKVEEMTLVGGENEQDRPLRADVTTTLVEGEEDGWTGFYVRTSFFLGTTEDPQAKNPATRRSLSWIRYKRFLVACGVAPTGRLDEETELVGGAEFIGAVGIRKYVSKRTGEAGEANTIKSFYKMGEKVLTRNQLANGLDKTATPTRSFVARPSVDE